jgi:hypothetical protein
MSLPEQNENPQPSGNENLPSGNENLPSGNENLPSGNENLPSGNEIATFAAVLLGASRVKAPGGGYSAANAQDIAQACKDALDLIDAAKRAAEAIRARGKFGDGFRVLEEIEQGSTASEQADEEESKPGAKLPPDIREQVKAAGWLGGPLGHARLPWNDFFSRFMLPKKSEKREECFRGWLKSGLKKPETLEARVIEFKERGFNFFQFIDYLQTFPAWWDEQKRLTNRSNGKLGPIAKKEGPKRRASKKSPVPKKKPSA